MGNIAGVSPHKEYREYNETECRYMMGTKAFPGDKCNGKNISEDKPSFCRIFAEHDTCYIGFWLGENKSFDVHFPKETTVELTKKETNFLRKTFFSDCGPEISIFKNSHGQLESFVVTVHPKGAFEILDNEGNSLNPTSYKGQQLYFPFRKIADQYIRFAYEGFKGKIREIREKP